MVWSLIPEKDQRDECGTLVEGADVRIRRSSGSPRWSVVTEWWCLGSRR